MLRMLAEIEKESKIYKSPEGNMTVTLPPKTPLNEYYSGGPLRISATDSTGHHHEVYFDNPMVLFSVEEKSIIEVSQSWVLDWELCWSSPVIQYQPGNDKWQVKYNVFSPGDVKACNKEHVQVDIPSFAQAVLFGLFIGEDAE